MGNASLSLQRPWDPGTLGPEDAATLRGALWRGLATDAAAWGGGALAAAAAERLDATGDLREAGAVATALRALELL